MASRMVLGIWIYSPNAADAQDVAHNPNIQDNNGIKDGTGDLEPLRNAADTGNDAHDYDNQDLLHLLRQLSEQSDEKLLGVVDKESGPFGTIMGFCDDKFGVLCADSLVTYQHENTRHGCDTALKIVQVTPRIGMVGLGSQHVFHEVKKRIEDFDTDGEFAFTMKDVVDCIKHITTECVEEFKRLYPGSADHNVHYIVLGKMDKGFEMYIITYNDASGCIVSERAWTRIVSGGSGHKALSTYQNQKPLRDIWVLESEAIVYCSQCMTHAVLEDKVHSGGDINMVLISNDKYQPFVFHENYVHGYHLAPYAAHER